MSDYMEMNFVKWIGHASFLIEGKQTIYIDPFKLSKNFGVADIIFITHSHFDHLSVSDISKIAGPSTIVIAPGEAKEKLKDFNVFAVEPQKKYDIKEIEFETIPAYNTKKERLGFHPKSNGWVGYVINVNSKSIYHAGDTDKVIEMQSIECDLALLPAGGTYTMDANEASEAASIIKARYVAPMHYKALLGKEGSAALEEKFRNDVKNSIILKEVQEPSYSF
ncbi:MAG: MBL fold metallo-hydrolase [Candidatus Micrarchaeia archaeon]